MSSSFLNRLSTRLTAAFIFSAVLGVVLVAILTYRYTSSDFSTFLTNMQGMQGMMGGMMGDQTFAQVEQDFLGSLRQTLWITGISGVVIAIALGAVFTRQIVAPLGKVAAAAGRVAKGNFKQKVNIGGAGELDQLGQAFNSMAATLERDQQLRRNMVADIAHELRTPLTVLQGNVEAMLDGFIPADNAHLTSLHQETLLLARLVDDLRTLSLAEAGQLEFRTKSVNLRALSIQVVESFRALLSAKHIDAKVDGLDNLPEVGADPERTAQVLRNLINNAIHYTPEGGKITVRVTSDTGGVTVSVIDAGIGISLEDLPRVFDRFYRVDRSRTRSSGGSGLGLAIVKQLVEAQQGRVWAESTPGKGSTFSFWLPLAK
ncbi:MAG: ATP-binding protein [Dehalococcoidales bacterium]|nr:ATP-binding protein [Dehalococcoidales bacterium]